MRGSTEEIVHGAGEPLGSVLSSLLLETNLRRLATRANVQQVAVTDLVSRFEMIELDTTTYRTAGLLPGPNLRRVMATLDPSTLEHLARPP